MGYHWKVPLKLDDLGVPLLQEAPKPANFSVNSQIHDAFLLDSWEALSNSNRLLIHWGIYREYEYHWIP